MSIGMFIMVYDLEKALQNVGTPFVITQNPCAPSDISKPAASYISRICFRYG